MYLTVHTAPSLIIGASTGNPILAFIFAFITHLILDIIPHDPKKLENSPNKKTVIKLFYYALIDLTLIIFLLLILWNQNKFSLNLTMFMALAGGIAPDVLWGFEILTKHKIKILKIYRNFHSNFIHTLVYKKKYLPLPWVILSQGFIFITTLWIYLKIIS